MLTYASVMYYSAMSDTLKKKQNSFEALLQTIPLQMLRDLNSNKVHYYGN